MEKPLFSKLNSIENNLKRIKITSNFASLNNVHEPRNAEFTAFLGSFYVVWQSNDNNFMLCYLQDAVLGRTKLFCIIFLSISWTRVFTDSLGNVNTKKINLIIWIFRSWCPCCPVVRKPIGIYLEYKKSHQYKAG